MLDLLVSSPFPLESSQGNAVSVRRLEKFFHELGYEARAVEGYDGCERARALVALNAWRSAGVVESFRKTNPGGKVIVQITGSDLYGEEIKKRESPTWRALETADAIAVFHEGALRDLPEVFHKKTFLTPNSVDVDRLPAARWRLENSHSGRDPGTAKEDVFPVAMIGNVRRVKAPAVLLGALERLPESSRVVANIYGDSGEKEMVIWLRRAEEENPRFRCMGRVSWENSIAAMLKGKLLVNTSIFEGGSNAVCEAMTLGVPILASEVPGNVGLLGADHGGLYPQGDSLALARLLEECERDPQKLLKLSDQSRERALLFTPEREKQGWKQLLKQVRF